MYLIYFTGEKAIQNGQNGLNGIYRIRRWLRQNLKSSTLNFFILHQTVFKMSSLPY